jgi:dolichyl-phosphate-mannose-protein mannosyltransferase
MSTSTVERPAELTPLARARATAAAVRLRGARPGDRLLGWLGPLAIAAVAGVLRFWRLGEPGEVVFDEVYYVDNARDYLEHGVEYDAEKDRPAYVVHPPVGKWMIAAGMRLLGDDPFGWRVAVAVLGTLAVLMIARIARRMLGSTLLGCSAGLLLALDGMAFVQSRTSLLDPVLMFWVLAAFGALLLDRDAFRRRLADAVPAVAAGEAAVRRFGPSGGVRWWRLVAGLCLGLACATKWSGAVYVAAFGLLAVAWDWGARRSAGVRKPLLAMLVRDAGPAFAALVVVALVVYVASWAGWFLADGETAYGRDWAATTGGGWAWAPEGLRSLWHYHETMWTFHRELSQFHPYRSNPWGWLLLSRPVSFHYEGTAAGDPGCAAAKCSEAVTALGTPAIWWAAVLALGVLVYLWAGRRDWRAGAILCAVAAGYLPWFLNQGRTIYSFYGVVFVPFLVLAVTLCLGLVLGRAGSSPVRRAVGASIVGAYLLVVVLNFWYLYPILSADTIPHSQWYARMWLRSWI